LFHAESDREIPTINNVNHSTVGFIDTTLPQPGYSYGHGARNLQAWPLNAFPSVAKLALMVENIARNHDISNTEKASWTDTYWNIGVNVVLYRNGRDHIGFHADDDQGKTVIFTVIIQSNYARRIVIKSTDESVRYDLFLQGGDAYCMDGEMQQHYKHGVPRVTSKEHVDEKRIVLVFRRGRKKMILRDTGQSMSNLQPTPPPLPRCFGQLHGMFEGHVYSMNELRNKFNAHSNAQMGVSGNKTDGCDSIIITHRQGTGYDAKEEPWHDFLYTGVQLSFGGLRINKTIEMHQVIRVCHSS
jgi:2OG-Fe(II) oxygenase superfamily